jgi:hypothetical protein
MFILSIPFSAFWGIFEQFLSYGSKIGWCQIQTGGYSFLWEPKSLRTSRLSFAAARMARYGFWRFLLKDSMHIDILCLFPETFASRLNQSIIKRAREQGLVNIVIHDIRDYTRDKHHTADDYPYGSGIGIKLSLGAFHFHALKPHKRGYSLKMANFTINHALKSYSMIGWE